MKYLKVLTTVLLSLSLSTSLPAQVEFDSEANAFLKEVNHNVQETGFSLFGFSQFNTLDSDFAFNEVPYQDPMFNFTPDTFQFTGDVTGSGDDNFKFSVLTHNPDSDDPGATMWKTFLFDEPSHIQNYMQYFDYRVVAAVGDMTNNGHADAFARMDEFDNFVLLEGSPNGYVFKGELGFNVADNIITNAIFADLDGDGYGDLLATTTTNIFVIFGNENISEIELKTIQPEWGTIRGFDAKVINEDTYVIFSSNSLLFGHFNDDREYVYSVIYNIATNFGTTRLADIRNNGYPDVIFGLSNDTVVIRASGFVEGELILEDEIEVLFEGFYPRNIGDITGNGFNDYCFLEDGVWKIGEGTEDLGGSFSTTFTLAYNDQSLICEWNVHDKAHRIDGKNYVLTQYPLDGDKFGSVFVRIEAGTMEFLPVLYNSSDYLASSVIATQTLGDINNNGYDDYAILRESEIDIYFGGQGFSETPDYILSGPPNSVTNKLIALDFTGNGEKELFVPWRTLEPDVSSTSYSVTFSFYDSTNLAGAPLHTFGMSDISEFDYVWSSQSINISTNGDVTGNGLDDILIGAPNVASQGNSNIWNNTVFLMEGSADFNSNIYQFEGGGASVTVLGDINGNGLSDMLMNRPITDINEAYIFYGSDSFQENFVHQAEDTLRITDPDNIFLLGLGGAVIGDFTGNGHTDVAIKPFTHDGGIDGGDAIFIFEGTETGIHLEPTHTLRLLVDAYIHPSMRPEGDTYRRNSLGTLASIPDMTGNGAHELLYTSNSFSDVNAGVYYGGSDIGSSHEPDVLLLSPNPYRGIGPNSNNITGHGVIAVGRFSDNTSMDIILPHLTDYRVRGNGAYLYSISTTTVSTPNENTDLPKVVELSQNYPNPFNPNTVIGFSLPESADVKLEVFDVLGKRVATLVNTQMTAGKHHLTFDARHLSSGMYIYRLTSGDMVVNRKMLLLK